MARLVLDFSAHVLVFSTEMQVRSTDINGANHLGNDALVSMFSEARARFLHHYGIQHSQGIIVTDLATQYLAEAYERDLLRFDLGVMDLNRYGGDIIVNISRPADQTDIARAKSGFVFFDYNGRKVAPMPKSFSERFPAANWL